MSTTTTTQTTRNFSGSSDFIGRLPLGVAIISILVGIVGFIILLDGILVLLLNDAFLNVGTSTGGVAATYGQITGGAIITIFGAVLLGSAVGLWDQRLWALVLAVIVSFAILVFELFSGGTLGIILAAVLFVYLLAVHRHFD